MSSSSPSSYSSSSPVLEAVPLPRPSNPSSPQRKRPRLESPVAHEEQLTPGRENVDAATKAARASSPSSSQSESEHGEEEYDHQNQQQHPASRQRQASSQPSQHQQHGQHPSEQHQPQPFLEEVPPAQFGLVPTFFGIDPLDEFTSKIGTWIWENSRGREHVEIEAKIGTIRDPNTNRRIFLPVQTETILQPSVDRRERGFSYFFDSDMTSAQHKHYNALLNQQFTETNAKPPAPTPETADLPPPPPMFPVKYAHLYEVDTFHAIESHGQRKVRVRTNKQTNQVVGCVEKVRISDLNVYCPGRQYDWRLSISVEMPQTELPSTPPMNPRHKDRVTYAHQVVQVDLTQVMADKGKKLHELEVELLDVPQFLEEAAAADRGEDNCVDALIGVLVGSVRMLVRNAA